MKESVVTVAGGRLSNNFTVLLDMDSTTYDLLNPTLAWINKFYNLRITPKDIKYWDWFDRLGINPYLFWDQEGTFLNLKPFPGAVEAIKTVHDAGIRQVFFSTVVTKLGAWEKFAAVDRDFPFIGRKNVLLTGGMKDLAKGGILFDDGAHNLKRFPGWKVMVDMYNAPYCTPHAANYVMTNWEQYPRILEYILGAKNGWREDVTC